MTFNQILKSKGLTQKKLVELLNKKSCFKYQQQISQWSKGIRVPDALSIYYMSQILEIFSDELLLCFLKSAGLLWLKVLYVLGRMKAFLKL